MMKLSFFLNLTGVDAERTSQLEIENDKTRMQLGECQWQKDKTEENLDKLTDTVDVTINKCKVSRSCLNS